VERRRVSGCPVFELEPVGKAGHSVLPFRWVGAERQGESIAGRIKKAAQSPRKEKGGSNDGHTVAPLLDLSKRSRCAALTKFIDVVASSVVRVVVFIDYQNMYRSAREAFGWENEKGHFGNFRPLPLGRALAQGENRELDQVRVYTGVPHPTRDKFGHSIMQRRIEAWRAPDPAHVEIFTRTLRYPPRQGREKGVDVQLAVDIVRLTTDDAFDVLILCSADTDLLPALEFVNEHAPDKTIETVAYAAESGCETAAPLDIANANVGRRLIEFKEFNREFADTRNYMIETVQEGRDLPGQSGRRLPPHRQR
jgi:uncharacterized LabA/DUF88 family protein